MVQPYLTYGIILWGPTYRCHLKQVSILHKKAIRCINKLYYNAHTEPLFIRNKILKLDDLYKFDLSKFMFDCINGKLPTPILEFFISNATIHAQACAQMRAGAFKCKCKCKRRIKCKCKCKCSASESNANASANAQQLNQMQMKMHLNQMQMHLNQMRINLYQMQTVFYKCVFCVQQVLICSSI